MKKTLSKGILCLMLLNTGLLASLSSLSQVKIGGAAIAPHSSAILELEGGATRGLLLPRMRKIDMLAIVDPAEALMVYITDEQAIYLRRQGNWIKLSGATDVFTLPYTGSFNVGTPVLSLYNSSGSGTGIYGAVNSTTGAGVHGHADNGPGYGIRGTGIFGRGGYFNSRFSHALITDTGKIGLGISTPTAFLHIDASKNTSDTTVIINDDDDPMIQFKKAGVIKSYIKQEGNNLVLRPNGQNFTGKVILQSYNDGPSMFVNAIGQSLFGVDPAVFGGTPLGATVNIRNEFDGNALTLDAPPGTGGPSMYFVENTVNTTTTFAEINANNQQMTFSHGAGTSRSYLWDGYFEPAMRLYLGPYPHRSRLGVPGRIGAGTMSPQAPLHVFADYLSGLEEPITAIFQGVDPIIHFRNYTPSATDVAFIQVVENDIKIGTFANNDKGRFIVRTNGIDRLYVDSVGYVTIGTNAKVGPIANGPYKLAVKGKIAATEFNVVSTVAWPDYVFNKSYKLTSLEETETFINENKHLPGIPPAEEIEKNGYGLSEMQKKMMEKIEELTLHLIQANKQIKLLEERLQVVEKK